MPLKKRTSSTKNAKGVKVTIKLSRAQLKKLLGGAARPKNRGCPIHETVQSRPNKRS
jgi:hypothetical protein